MESADFNIMRRAMVDSQLRTSGVTAPWVLAAMGSVARENFAPAPLRSIAYSDRSIALADGRMLNPPASTALMLQGADVSADDRVLLIGAADGYVAALLKHRNRNITVASGAADLPGIARGEGFTLIFIDGAIEELPDGLLALAAEGARIVTGVHERGVTSLALGHVRGGKVALRSFADSEIALLPEFVHKPEFVF